MKIAPLAEVKAKFSRYLEMCERGPIIVTKNGRPAAALVAVSDEKELERLVLAHTPKFMAMLSAAERRIKKGKGVKHKEFWKSVKQRKGNNLGRGSAAVSARGRRSALREDARTARS